MRRSAACLPPCWCEMEEEHARGAPRQCAPWFFRRAAAPMPCSHWCWLFRMRSKCIPFLPQATNARCVHCISAFCRCMKMCTHEGTHDWHACPAVSSNNGPCQTPWSSCRLCVPPGPPRLCRPMSAFCYLVGQVSHARLRSFHVDPLKHLKASTAINTARTPCVGYLCFWCTFSFSILMCPNAVRARG